MLETRSYLNRNFVMSKLIPSDIVRLSQVFSFWKFHISGNQH